MSPSSTRLFDGRRWLRLSEVAVALVCGRTRVYELVQRGHLLAVGEGRSRRVTAESLIRYAEGVEAEARRERGLRMEVSA